MNTFPTGALPFALPVGTERLLPDQHLVVRLRTTPTSTAALSLQGSRTLVEQTYAWNSRKRRFSASQIELARDILIQKNWIVVTGDAGSAAT